MKIQAGRSAACTTIAIHDTQSKMPAKFEFDHIIHPTTLDACFQGTFAPSIGSNRSRELTSIKSIYVSANLPKGAGSEFVGYSTLDEQGFDTLVGSVTMSDKLWTGPKVTAKGLNYKMRAKSSGATMHKKQSWEIKKICSNLVWKPDLDHVSQSQAAELFAPSPSEINSANGMISKWLELSGHKKPYQRILEVSGGSTLLTLQALESLGGQNGKTPCFSQYVFTDKDSKSWDSACESLKPWEDHIQFKEMTFASSPADQDFKIESFDVVLASQVRT